MEAVTPGGMEIVSTGHYANHGIEGKDAVLVEGLNNSHLHREVTRDVFSNGRNAEVATLESKYQMALLSKDAELRAQAMSFENRLELMKTKAELLAGVVADGEKTRALITASAAA